MTDFHRITPCGECCDGCRKMADGQCRGCIETGGHCEEWAGSGICPTYACCMAHSVPFCGVCPDYEALCWLFGWEEEAKTVAGYREAMENAILDYGWDGKWFLRAYDAFGKKIINLSRRRLF